MKKIKKIISLLLSFTMFISAVVCVDLSAYASGSGDYTYKTVTRNTVKITGYSGSDTEITIPSELNGYTVTSIGDYAFYYCTSLMSVTIPDGVTSIGSSAFYYCTSLMSVTIPDGVTSIGSSAFSHCSSLESVTIGDNVTNIGNFAFYYCTSLESVTIPDGVTSIGNYAFYKCTSLTSITIPDSVTSIGSSAFYCCESLESVTIGDNVTNIGNYAFYYCTSLMSVTIPDGVTSIGNYAFYCCESLTSITIPDSVTSIGDNAFSYCSSLESVTIGDNVTNIGNYAFEGCTSLTSIIIPDSVTSIGRGTFWSCIGLKSITLPDTVEEIGNYAFFLCRSLISIELSNSLKFIGDNAFDCCYSLSGTLTLPDSVEKIGESAFELCYNLSLIEIGSGLKFIGDGAFSYSTGHFSVASENEYFSSDEGILFNKDKTELIKYPADYEETSYTVPLTVKEIREGAFSQSNLTEITMTDVEIIGNEAFSVCEKLTSVSLPDTVTEIGDFAFSRCTGLTEIKLNSGLKRIGNFAFQYCKKIETIEFPDSLTSIGNRAFQHCNNLNEAVISKNVSSIGNAIFQACNMAEIQVDSGNEYFTVSDGVLFDKDMTTLIQYPSEKTDEIYTVPDGVKNIGSYSFSENDYLEEVSISDSVTYIECDAFYQCDGLAKVTVGCRVSKIGWSAFGYCDVLSEIYFKGNASDEFDEHSFYGVTANAYYADGDDTWTEDIREDLGDGLTWYTWDTPVFTITDISSCTVSLSTSSYTYNGNAKKPTVTVKDGSDTLTKGIDYTVAYSDNVNAGTATVTITGIGNYENTITKSFTINKADQYVSASLSYSSIEVGNEVSITAYGTGSLTYSSNKTSVATVSSSGVITAVAAGTATITVTASGDSNYKSGSNTVQVTVVKAVESVTLDTLTYSFSNSSKSFGYSSTYKIPLERYKMFYSDTVASYYYTNSGTWGGSCFGFSTTSMMFNMDSSTLNISSFNSSADKVSDLKVTDENTTLDLTVTELLEAMQISQSTTAIASAHNSTYNDLEGLCAEVKKCDDGGAPVKIGVRRSGYGGHAILGYKIEKISSTKSYLYVYDCNYPNTTRYITLTTDSSGNYTGWYYKVNDLYNYGTNYSGSNINYVTYDVIEATWEGRNTNLDYDTNTLFVSSDNFEIQNINGDTIATMSDGVFTSTSDDIFEGSFYDVEYEDHIIYMPTDAYRIVDEGTDVSEELEVTMLNVDQSVEVVTTADVVDLLVDDKQAANIANVVSEYDDKYEITLTSGLDTAENMEEVTYRGRCREEEATVGTSYFDMVADNYSGSGVFVNDTSVNFRDGENEIVLSDDNTEINMSDASYTYNGKRTEAEIQSVVYDSKTLVEGVDYTVVYSNNTNVGTAYATVFGINDYKGKATATYEITPKDASTCTVHSYSATVTNPTCTQQGYTTYTCTICGYSYNDNYISATGHSFGDNGQYCTVCGAVNPNYVDSTVNNGTSSSATDSTVSSSGSTANAASSNAITNADSSTSTSSTASISKPKKTKIKKLTKKKKAIKVTWKKKSGVSGYQIQVATNKKFTKNKKTVTVKGASKISKTIKKLKSKKTYYVRVRTYKTVNGKKVYSSWSTVKKVKTK